MLLWNLADLDYDGLNHHDPLAERICTNEELNLTAEQIERIQRKRKVPAAGWKAKYAKEKKKHSTPEVRPSV